MALSPNKQTILRAYGATRLDIAFAGRYVMGAAILPCNGGAKPMADLGGMDLTAADLGLRVQGRKAQPPMIAVLGPLMSADLAQLEEARGSTAAPLKKLRERHHAVARALASGMKPGEAANMYGYSASRVSILQADPSFADLVKFYTVKTDEKYYGMHDRMSALGQDAVDEIQDRLEDSPEDFSIGQLLEVSKAYADRTGHGVTTTTEVNVKVGLADRLAAARKRADDAIAARTIDVTPEPV